MINPAGDIVGTYCDNNTCHGYLLSDGTFSTIEPVDSVFTIVTGITPAGEIVGLYVDASNAEWLSAEQEGMRQAQLRIADFGLRIE